MKDVCCLLKWCNEPHHSLGFCLRHYARIQPMEHPFRERKNRAAGFGLSNEERFNYWIDKSNAEGCWTWKGWTGKGGYGMYSEVKDGIRGNKRRYIMAHRKAYEFAHGPIPEGLVIRHKCDNKICVRLDHLETGTTAENSADSMERELYLKGESHPQAKINDQIVRLIRASKERVPTLAKRYNISTNLIYKIRSRECWKHVT